MLVYVLCSLMLRSKTCICRSVYHALTYLRLFALSSDIYLPENELDEAVLLIEVLNSSPHEDSASLELDEKHNSVTMYVRAMA